MIACSTVPTFGQDRPSYNAPSLADLRNTVKRVVNEQGVWGIDIKVVSRSGDMTAVAILQTLSDGQLEDPDTRGMVLYLLHEAFGCPSGCVDDPYQRVPRITMLLLSRLRRNSGGKLRSQIDATEKYISKQTRKAD
jgi:hypothetical protein